MKKISLNGKWKFTWTEPLKEGLSSSTDRCGTGEWYDINVPGDVNDALIKQGIIPDIFINDNAQKAYWVTSKDWYYRYEFDFDLNSLKNTCLCFYGLDCIADIWLNEKHVSATKNAFREYSFDVTGIISRKNVILVRFGSLDEFFGGKREDILRGWNEKRTFIRKPQYTFGWDWAIPIPSIGIEGGVWLETDTDLKFREYAIQTFKDGRVDFYFEVTRYLKTHGYSIEIEIFDENTSIVRRLDRKSYKCYDSIKIENPKLWWPNGFGDPHLYDYRIRLIFEGATVDKREGKFGLRECKIVEEPLIEEKFSGISFRINVNGKDIFCKGANWICMELWPGIVREEDYAFYIEKVKEADFNMLRVWGGCIYEREEFYRLCDLQGIMVWQDYMFASGGYPFDLLKDEVFEEAVYQTKRLRNHPSVVLWCGINEDNNSWTHPDDQEEGYTADFTEGRLAGDELEKNVHKGSPWTVDRRKYDPQLFSAFLRGISQKYGLGVPYVDSSPESKEDYGNDPNSGNCHISAWKYGIFETGGQYEKWPEHMEKRCSFNSEFCIQGPCSIKTFKKMLDAKNYWPPNDMWIFRIQRGHENLPHFEQTIMLGEATFGVKIDSLEDYVKYGQAVHLEMMRRELESARRDWPFNGGTMVWMLNDCWPNANWSVIEYNRECKPAYYAAKRACRPVLPIIMEREGRIEFFLSNNSNKNVRANIEYGIENMDGDKRRMGNTCIECNANTCTKFHIINKNELDMGKDEFLFVGADTNGGMMPKSTYFINGWKNINWPETDVTIKEVITAEAGSKHIVRILTHTEKYARLCHIDVDVEREDALAFSDNYFDMPANSERWIEIYSDSRIDAGKIAIGHWTKFRREGL